MPCRRRACIQDLHSLSSGLFSRVSHPHRGRFMACPGKTTTGAGGARTYDRDSGDSAGWQRYHFPPRRAAVHVHPSPGPSQASRAAGSRAIVAQGVGNPPARRFARQINPGNCNYDVTAIAVRCLPSLLVCLRLICGQPQRPAASDRQRPAGLWTLQFPAPGRTIGLVFDSQTRLLLKV